MCRRGKFEGGEKLMMTRPEEKISLASRIVDQDENRQRTEQVKHQYTQVHRFYQCASFSPISIYMYLYNDI